MKIYNNMNITYSAIEQNSRKNTKQNIPADLEKKITQYTDTLSISKTGQEIFKHLSSVSFMDYVNRFENIWEWMEWEHNEKWRVTES